MRFVMLVLAVALVGLRSSPGLREQSPGYCDLRKLELDVATVVDELGADFHQLLVKRVQ